MTDGPSTRIQLRCDCGARLNVLASAVGRKLRCPKCQRISVVRRPDQTPDAPSHPAAPANPTASPPPASADRIRVRCACGAKMAVAARFAGRKARCPQCGGALVVPQAGAPPAPPAVSENIDALLGGLAGGETVAIAPPLTAIPPPDSIVSRNVPGTSAAAHGHAQTCPSCAKSLPSDAKICVACGIYIKTGRPLLTAQEDSLDQAYAYAERAIGILSWLIPVGVYPIASEAFGLRKPWTTRAIAVATVLASVWFMVAVVYNPEPSIENGNLMLWSGRATPAFSPSDAPAPPADETDSGPNEPECTHHTYQLFTHAWLHGGLLHLAGNMLFLLVLGARVNALIGNILTVLLYPLLAIIAGMAHAIAVADQPLTPMLGASGAVMGLAGMYLVLFPVHRVHMAAWYRWGLVGGFHLHLRLFPVPGFFVVLFYIAFDVVYTVAGLQDQVAHWAHLGGFIAGTTLAFLLLGTRLVNARGGDILSALLGRHAWALIGKPNRPGLSLW
jgi:membrane associated rhomboid family serine protease